MSLKKLDSISPFQVPWLRTYPVLATVPVQVPPWLLTIVPLLASMLPFHCAPALLLMVPALVMTLPVHTPGVLLLMVPVLLATLALYARLLSKTLAPARSSLTVPSLLRWPLLTMLL